MSIILEAVEKFMRPEPVEDPMLVLIVGAGILMNSFCFAYDFVD